MKMKVIELQTIAKKLNIKLSCGKKKLTKKELYEKILETK